MIDGGLSKIASPGKCLFSRFKPFCSEEDGVEQEQSKKKTSNNGWFATQEKK